MAATDPGELPDRDEWRHPVASRVDGGGPTLDRDGRLHRTDEVAPPNDAAGSTLARCPHPGRGVTVRVMQPDQPLPRSQPGPQPVSPVRPRSAADGRLRRRRWLTVLGAIAAANAVVGSCNLAGVTLAVRSAGAVSEIESLRVNVTTVGVGLLAWGSLEALEHLRQGGRHTWRRLAGGVALLSLLGPLSAATLAAGVGLLALHLVVGGILLLCLPTGGVGWRPGLGFTW